MIDIRTGREMSRRDFGRGLAACIATGCAPFAARTGFAARHGIGLRSAAWAAGGWVNPYVTDGLVAMWDGEWNAGGGVHDANATVWKDLVSQNEAVLIYGDMPHFGDKSIIMPNTGLICEGELPLTIANALKAGDAIGIEICFHNQINSGNNRALFSLKNKMADKYFLTLEYNDLNNFWIYSRAHIDGNYQHTNIVSAENKNRICAYCSEWRVRFEINDYKSGYYDRNWSQATVENTDCLFIGWFQNATSYLFKGEIFSVRIYDRILTDAEIAANYAIDKARFNLT